MPTFRIELVHKYESHLYAGDYSHGTFFEGYTVAKDASERDAIIARFKDKGEIELKRASNRYLTKDTFDESTLVEFLNPDHEKNLSKWKFERKEHVFGDGFVAKDETCRLGDRCYTYFFWLSFNST
jgi:hypothetical protein